MNVERQTTEKAGALREVLGVGAESERDGASRTGFNIVPVLGKFSLPRGLSESVQLTEGAT